MFAHAGIVRDITSVTEQYLVHITGTRFIVWMSTSDVEVLGMNDCRINPSDVGREPPLLDFIDALLEGVKNSAPSVEKLNRRGSFT